MKSSRSQAMKPLDWLQSAKRFVQDFRHDLIGGPVDTRHPRESSELSRHSHLAGHVAVLEAATWGEHHAGAPPGLSTESELGIAFRGATSGDRYHAEVKLLIPGFELRCNGKVRKDGVSMLYRGAHRSWMSTCPTRLSIFSRTGRA